jgi:hypothetical protein
MDLVRRFDFAGTFRKPEKTSQGFLRADALPTRTGVFVYRKADGSEFRELRLPEEVFHPDSLKSLELAPLTDNHPPEPITAENVAKYAIGSLGENPQPHGKHVKTSIQVMNADAIRKLEARQKDQLSGGYTCVLDMTPGVYEGERYDAIQRTIRYNHVALVAAGRAGPENRIRLDSNDAVSIDTTTAETGREQEQHHMVKIRIDGVDYEVSEQCAQAFNKDAEARKTEVANLKAEVSKHSARADSAEADAQKARDDAKVANDPKRIQEAVTARVSLEKVADKVQVKADGLSDDDLRKAIVAKVRPSFKLDDKDAAYIKVAFDLCLEQLEKQDTADLRRDLNAAQGNQDAADKIKQHRANQENAWKQPLTAVKGAN